MARVRIELEHDDTDYEVTQSLDREFVGFDQRIGAKELDALIDSAVAKIKRAYTPGGE